MYLCILIALTGIGFYSYLALSWKAYVREETIQHLIEVVNSAPRMSGEFYGIYDRLYPDRLLSMQGLFGRSLFSGRDRREKNYYCKVAGLYYPGTLSERRYSVLRMLDVAFALEQYASPEKCFDYYMSRSDRETKLLPPIHELRDTTAILERLVRMKAPFYYRMHPEKLNEGMEHLKARVR